MDSGLLAGARPRNDRVTFILTVVTISVTFLESNLAHEGRLREGSRRPGRVRCPRADLPSAPGRLRASASWHYRPGCEVLAGRGQVKGGNARTNCAGSAPGMGMITGSALIPSPRKHGLKQSLWEEISLWREPWWNADRRARPQRRVGASRHSRGASRTRWCGHETLRL